MPGGIRIILLGAVCFLAAAPFSLAGETTVLDGTGFWCTHYTLCPPVIKLNDRLQRALIDPVKKRRIGRDLVERCREMLDERLQLMWKSLSNLQMHGGGADSGAQYATGWRWAPGICGQTWFIGSGWQERSEKLFSLAWEAAGKPGKR